MPKTEPSASGSHQNVESHPATKKQPLYGKELWGNDPHLSDKGADTGQGYDYTKDPYKPVDDDKIPNDWNQIGPSKNGKTMVR